MYDVYVQLPPEEAAERYRGTEAGETLSPENTYVYVTSCGGDLGEITTACQVLFPTLIGIAIEPMDQSDRIAEQSA